MQPRLGFYSIVTLNNMRSVLLLVILTICICFEFANGIKAPTSNTAPVFSKLSDSVLTNEVLDNKATMLGLKGG